MKRKESVTPLVVARGGWGDTVPEWLKLEIESERMLSGFAALRDEGKDNIANKVGDAEVLAYLMTLAPSRKLTSEATNIYLYLARKVMKACEQLEEVPEDIRVKALTGDEERELSDLRWSIYKARGGDLNHPVIEALTKLKKSTQRKKR